MIYFIQNGQGGPITVCRGREPFSKARKHKVRQSEYLILLASGPGTADDQRSTQLDLEPFRLPGSPVKWYSPEPEVLSAAEDLRDGRFPEFVEEDGRTYAVLNIDPQTGKTEPCPFCRKPHSHGKGSSGHKVAHCVPSLSVNEIKGPDVSLYPDDGYVVSPTHTD